MGLFDGLIVPGLTRDIKDEALKDNLTILSQFLDELLLKGKKSVLVNADGNQTVNDIKTFTSFPVTPSSAPTTNYQVTNKKYVDDQIVSANLWEVDGTETQLKTADEIDMQSKKIINVTDPASNQDAATKAYSDLMKIASILDYSTSASSSTARAQAALKICYGSVAVAHEADGSGHTHITNLPFTDANSYIIELTENRDTSDAFEMNVAATRVSGSEAIFLNPSAANDKVVFWFAIGI